MGWGSHTHEHRAHTTWPWPCMSFAGGGAPPPHTPPSGHLAIGWGSHTHRAYGTAPGHACHSMGEPMGSHIQGNPLGGVWGGRAPPPANDMAWTLLYACPVLMRVAGSPIPKQGVRSGGSVLDMHLPRCWGGSAPPNLPEQTLCLWMGKPRGVTSCPPSCLLAKAYTPAHWKAMSCARTSAPTYACASPHSGLHAQFIPVYLGP